MCWLLKKSINNNKDESNCNICLERLVDIDQTKIRIFSFKCGHLICENCLLKLKNILKIFSRNKNSFVYINKCPVCNQTNIAYPIDFNNSRCSKCLKELSILLDKDDKIYSLICGHIFCLNCLNNLKNFKKLHKCDKCTNYNESFRLYL